MIRFLSFLGWLALSSFTTASAASLSVSPILLRVVTPSKQTILTVNNLARRQVTVQLRVFKWVLRDGKDYFLNTRDVIVSPPIARLRSNGSLQVRILCTSSQPVVGEETYRVIVDEVPDANRVRNVGVNLALRYTLPLFFLNPSARQPRLTWSVRGSGKRRQLLVQNNGDVHVRLAALAIGNFQISKGLAGYALGRSVRIFDLPPRAPSSGRVTAITGQGKLSAAVRR
jgi:fimbrial chaperone protein